MQIHCGICREELTENDYIVMDWFNSLYHQQCYECGSNNIQDIDTYENIKEKYWFFAELRLSIIESRNIIN